MGNDEGYSKGDWYAIIFLGVCFAIGIYGLFAGL